MTGCRSLGTAATLAALLLLPASGCLWIPTPEHGLLEGRGAIGPQETALLQEGTTTREEVLLKFGEPDARRDSDRVFAYHWTVAHGYIAVGAYYSGTVAPVRKHYLLMLAFDDTGTLLRWELLECVFASAEGLLDKWARGSPPPPSPPPPG